MTMYLVIEDAGGGLAMFTELDCQSGVSYPLVFDGYDIASMYVMDSATGWTVNLDIAGAWALNYRPATVTVTHNGPGAGFEVTDIIFGGQAWTPPSGVTAETPVISPAAGTYYNGRAVSIECDTPLAEIRYTLDGTTPDSGSLLYSEAFMLPYDATTTVKAIAIAGDYWAESAVASSEFTTEEYEGPPE